VYPVDRPTYRIMTRHGWIHATADYEEARAAIEEPARGDLVVLANLGSWLGRIGELHCRAKVADCKQCPLEPFLPTNGPIGAIAE
jgi:endonuclease III